MTWNAPKDKSPWQSDKDKKSNKPSSNEPPDLEAMFRQFFSKFSHAWGGGKQNHGHKPDWKPPQGASQVLAIAIGAVVFIYMLMGVYIVAPAERAVITQFGRYVKTVGPGPHWLPWIIRDEQKVDVSQVMSSQHSGYMLTTDQNIVYLELAVQYRIDDPEAYLFNVKDPIGSLQQSTDSAMRQVVGAETLERILTTGRAEIRQKISDNIVAMLQKYNSGLALVDLAMQPAKVPEPVRTAFDDVIKALEDKDRMENQANAYSTRMVQVARGQAARYMEEAEAYRTQVESRAQGEVNRFNSVYEEYRKAPGIMRERLYLQSMEQVYTNTSKILVDSNMGNNMIYLPLDKMMENARTSVTTPPTASEEAASATMMEEQAANMQNIRNNTRNRSGRYK
jgi:modulator of FtsH protease HflK